LCPAQAAALNKAYAKYKATGVNPSVASNASSSTSPLNLATAQSAIAVLTQGAAKNLKALGLQNLDLKHMFLPTLPTK
jgi:hypothetical protein